MHILTTEELSAIERDADHAPVQQLRLHVAQVTQALSSKEPDVADYAGALLLKLERLIDCRPTARAGSLRSTTNCFQRNCWPRCERSSPIAK